MSVVAGALGSLVPKLALLLHDEYKLQKGVKKQVESLSRELDSIYPFLQKVSDVPWNRLDGQVKTWAREVREASYDVEDILDTFLVRVKSSKDADSSSLVDNMGDLFRKAKARRDIAGKIKDMTKHLEEVAERRQKYKLDEIMCKQGTTTSGIDPRLTAMYKEVEQLIGVDKSRDELIALLNPSQLDHAISDKKMMKVSIVGVGGLGKTTLAKVVYDKIKSQYDCGAFVSIGRERDLVQVFKDILFLLDEKNHGEIHNTGRSVDILVHQLREFLDKKRYFIVIDDVWEVRTWKAIQLALVENNCGSKVVTTTRKFDVAEQAGEVYKLKPLSYDDSMKLFDTRILGADRKHLDNQPNDVSNKILKKCAGIPLAIITMASLFAGKPECEWSDLYSSIGFDTKDNRESEDTMTILSFSYYDLPPHLRTCLLYLSAYPEDSEIRKISLIWKWIAEGFIDQKQGTRLFDLGERYFNDLINRSLIQGVGTSRGGDTVYACRVHDMILDLMRKLSSEENFIAILGDSVERTPPLSNVRRLAQQNRIAEHINSEAMVTGMPKVRSYTAFMSCIDNRDQFLRFKLLRVLDIAGPMLKEGYHLEHLGDLLHLRYLGIRLENSGDHLELPKQIGNLKFLQTLDVYGTLPASIVQLTQLVRLDAYPSKAPDGIGNLTSLEELSIRIRGNSETRFMKELGSLRELRVLRFSADGMVESTQRHFVKSLCNLKKIQQIWVLGRFSKADTAVWEAAGFVLPRPLRHLDWFLICFSKLPPCINPSRLPNLSFLKLTVDTMDEQDLKLLARLPVLCVLRLATKSTITATNINDGDGCFFNKLWYFGISGMVQFEQHCEEDTSVSLHIWNGVDAIPFGSRKIKDSSKVVSSGVMPNVEILSFPVYLRALKVNNGDCRNIGLKYLPSLQEVNGSFHCDGMSAEEVDAALDVLRDECKIHPNHPTLQLDRWPWDQMKERNVSKKENEKQEEEAGEASLTADNVDVGKLSPSSS